MLAQIAGREHIAQDRRFRPVLLAHGGECIVGGDGARQIAAGDDAETAHGSDEPLARLRAHFLRFAQVRRGEHATIEHEAFERAHRHGPSRGRPVFDTFPTIPNELVNILDKTDPFDNTPCHPRCLSWTFWGIREGQRTLFACQRRSSVSGSVRLMLWLDCGQGGGVLASRAPGDRFRGVVCPRRALAALAGDRLFATIRQLRQPHRRPARGRSFGEAPRTGQAGQPGRERATPSARSRSIPATMASAGS